MRLNLFWRLGLAFLALLLVVLLAVDLYAERVLRRNYLRQGFERLDALSRLAAARPPQIPAEKGNPAALRDWVAWMAQGGARVTGIARDGLVLADSAQDRETIENHSNRPEIRDALAAGQGKSVRHSATLDRDLVYLALRHQPAGREGVILRFARLSSALTSLCLNSDGGSGGRR